MPHRQDIKVENGLFFGWRRRGRVLAPAAASSSGLRRLCFGLIGAFGGLATLAVLGFGGLAWRLSSGPIALPWLSPRIEKDLGKRLGPGYSVSLGETKLESSDKGPILAIDGLTLKDPQGRTLVAAPKAAVAVDPMTLGSSNVTASRLDLYDLDVKFVVRADGGIAISAGGDQGPGLQFALPAKPGQGLDAVLPQATPANGVKDVVLALRGLLDAATDPGNALGALDRLGIARGRLVFSDEATGEVSTFDGLDFSLEKAGGASLLKAGVNGPAGHWSLSAALTGAAGAARTLDVEVRDISFNDIALLMGLRDRAVDFDMPLSLKASLGVSPEGELTRAAANFVFGAGYFKLADPDHEPMLIDEFTGALAWDPESRRIRLSKAELFSGETHINASGEITPPAAAAEPWAVAFDAGPGVIGPERPGDKALPVTQGLLRLRAFAAEKRIVLDQFKFGGADFGLDLSGASLMTDAGPTLELAMTAPRMPIRNFVRLWPSFVAPHARNWFVHHITAGEVDRGVLRLAFDGATFADARAERPLPEGAYDADFTVIGGAVDIMPGLPALSGIDGVGHVGGRSAKFDARHGAFELGNGRRVLIPEVAVTFPDTAAKPPSANVTGRFQGSIEALVDLLSRDALKEFAGLPEDAASLKGQVDGQASIDLRLVKKIGPDDVGVKYTAQATNASRDAFIGKERLEAASLSISGDKGGPRAKGEGRLFGAPAAIEVKRLASGKSEASVSFSLDEAARARLGLSAGAALTGPVLVKAVAAPIASDPGRAQIEVDLSRAAIDGLLPGWGKPAGRPGKASFIYNTDDKLPDVEQFALDAGGVAIRGSADFDDNGKFTSAKLTQFRLSPGDDMRADIVNGSEGLKLTVRGTAIDARPFLQSFLGQSADMQALRDVDIDLKSTAITGYNKQALAGADLRLVKRGGNMRQLSLNGRFGGDAASATLVTEGGGVASYRLVSQDAGAALSFLDLYRHMRGGSLQIDIKAGERQQSGSLTILDFMIKDEPAMRRLANEAARPGGTEPDAGQVQGQGAQGQGVQGQGVQGQAAQVPGARAASPQALQIDPTSVPFAKLQARFARAAGRTDISDGVMWGAQIGASVSGYIDFSRDRVDLGGAFVPAYQLNNLFAKIPLVGPILGGGANEGLFAINYRISGAASAPVLHVNPLSAIAPGFLRKIFGAIDGTAQPAAGVPPPALER